MGLFDWFTGKNVVTAAEVAASVLPVGKAGNPLFAGITTAGTYFQNRSDMNEATQLMGDGVHLLHVDSPAFKEYAKKLSNRYAANLTNLGVGLAGSAAGGAAFAAGIGMLALGPPGWIGSLAIGAGGLVASVAGGTAASMAKEAIMPTENNMFLDLAKNLQASGQAQQMTAEQSFVALAMNIPTAEHLQEVLKAAGFKSVNEMVAALGTEQGLTKIQLAMQPSDDPKSPDAILRAATGFSVPTPGIPVAQHYANLVNEGKLAGVDLLSLEKTGAIALQINQNYLAALQNQPTPLGGNNHLPQKDRTLTLGA